MCDIFLKTAILKSYKKQQHIFKRNNVYPCKACLQIKEGLVEVLISQAC